MCLSVGKALRSRHYTISFPGFRGRFKAKHRWFQAHLCILNVLKASRELPLLPIPFSSIYAWHPSSTKIILHGLRYLQILYISEVWVWGWYNSKMKEQVWPIDVTPCWIQSCNEHTASSNIQLHILVDIHPRYELWKSDDNRWCMVWMSLGDFALQKALWLIGNQVNQCNCCWLC